MADFCKQCSIRYFGEDFKELAGITKQEDFEKDLAVAVICEGCGPIHVAPDGSCVSVDCLAKGHKPKEKPLCHCGQPACDNGGICAECLETAITEDDIEL